MWDGNCGFCRFWKTRWQKMSNGKLDFEPFQNAHAIYTDIDPEIFKRSVCLIDTEGKIHTGAKAVFRSFVEMGKYQFLNRWYESSKLFRNLSESAYRFVANNRGNLLDITSLFFGKDPEKLKHYWVIYLLLLVVVLLLVTHFL